MRKHSKGMAARWTREPGDRSNQPQVLGHYLANLKSFQLQANALLRNLLKRVEVV